MIPFDLETWKANPGCEVYDKRIKEQVLELHYHKGAQKFEGFRCLSGLDECGVLQTYRVGDLMLKLPETNAHPNADVIHAFADGLDVYFNELHSGRPRWVLYDPVNNAPPYLGDPNCKWHIGKPKE